MRNFCVLCCLISLWGCQSTLPYSGLGDTDGEDDAVAADTQEEGEADAVETEVDTEEDSPFDTATEDDTVSPDTTDTIITDPAGDDTAAEDTAVDPPPDTSLDTPPTDTVIDDPTEEVPTPVCGNSITEAGEDCDDGNHINNDSCIECVWAICGDGFQWWGMEGCDDANTLDCDGCSNLCQTETAMSVPLSHVGALINTAPCMTANATWEFWFKNNSSMPYYRPIFSQQWGNQISVLTDNSGPDYIWWQFHADPSTAVDRYVTVGTMPAGEWNHIAITRERVSGSNWAFRTFVNGLLVDTYNYSATAWWCSNQTLYIVGSSSGSGFDGLIDDIRLSSATLYTANFVPELRLAATVDTVALWAFNGSLATDGSGNGYNLTILDGTLWPSDECHTP